MNCPKCGSPMIRRGYTAGRKEAKYICKKCKHYETIVLQDNMRTFRQKKNTAEVTVRTTVQIKNEKQLIKEAGIDTDVWEIEEWECKVWESPRAHRIKKMSIVSGVSTGNILDEGKMTVVPLWSVTVKLVYKRGEVKTASMLTGLLDDLKKYRFPKRKTVRYKQVDLTYELDFPDLQFGRLSWNEESGENFDVHIARDVYMYALEDLLSRLRGERVARVILPIGHDFFNADGKNNETSHGTPQQMDTRWEKTFRAGCAILRDTINICLDYAPVYVVDVPGNHDEAAMFYMGEILSAVYHNNKHVTIDNSVKLRKYLQWGRNFLGMTHGYHEPLNRLPGIMAAERPEAWGASLNREWHVGDKHHAKVMDFPGCTIRQVRSLSALDTWTFNRGFVGIPKSAQAFLWHDEEGIIDSPISNVPRYFYE